MSTVTDSTNSYAVGTAVWVKIFNRIWWPGVVEDENLIPYDLKVYKEGLKQQCIAVVKFLNEDKYEIVLSPKKILLYSSEKKIEFLEKGLTYYKLQKRGVTIIGNCNMDRFFADVRTVESFIKDGDKNVIHNLQITLMEKEERRKSIKELFTPSTSKKTKKKMDGKKPLPAVPNLIRPLIITEKTIQIESKPSTSCNKSTPIQTFENSETATSRTLSCYKDGCLFKTNNLNFLKCHKLTHEKKKKEEKTKETPKSTKRKNLKTNSPDNKKKKLQGLSDNLTDGHDDEGLEGTVLDSCIVKPTTMEPVQATNEVVVTINNILPTVCKPSTSSYTSTSDGNVISSISVGSANVVENSTEVLTNDIVPESRECNIANIFNLNDIDCNLPDAEASVPIMIDSDDWLQHSWETFTEEEIKQAKMFYDLSVQVQLPYTKSWPREGLKFETHEFTTDRYADKKNTIPRSQLFKLCMLKANPTNPNRTLDDMINDPQYKALTKAASEGKTLTLRYVGPPTINTGSSSHMLVTPPPELHSEVRLQSEVKKVVRKQQPVATQQIVSYEIIDLDSSSD